MEIVVADANIFVYLFRCGIIKKFLSNKQYQIIITQEVLDEITNKNRRISRDRENQGLSEVINRAIHNQNLSEDLQVINIRLHEFNLEALGVYNRLSDDGELDAGEIESIPLAFDLQGRFLSNDTDAIIAANEMRPGLGIYFQDFCKELLQLHIIEQSDLDAIIRLLK